MLLLYGKQSKAYIQENSVFFSNFFPVSHSGACEIGDGCCCIREKGFLGLLLFDDNWILITYPLMSLFETMKLIT